MGKVVLPNEVVLGEAAHLLAEGHEVVVVPKGRSMLPFIRGDEDKVVLNAPKGIKVGDIVLAHFGGRFILHRIIAIDGDQVTLMGDGNLQGTEQGRKEEIAGIVTDIITPKGRHRKPTNGWLWRKLLPIRKYLLKIYRKWNKLKNKIQPLPPSSLNHKS